MEERKRKILERISNGGVIPSQNLLKFIEDGVVTINELMAAGLDKASVEDLLEPLREEESDDWNEIQQIAKSDVVTLVEKLSGYINKYSIGSIESHIKEAKSELANIDDSYWEEYVMSDPTEKSLNEYKRLLPNGSHLSECEALINDLPWLETVRIGTIQAFEKYRSAYPTKHVDEISSKIEDIKDESDWHVAFSNKSKYAFEEYLEKHPNGKHRLEAEERINHRDSKDILLEDLRSDKNRYNPKQLQIKVENGELSWEDLSSVFDYGQIEAIRSWTEAANLPFPDAPAQLKKNMTEVYLWGLKASGKTCALGSILSAADDVYRILVPVECSGAAYRDYLSGLFKNDGTICTLPVGNPLTNKISEMCMCMREIPDDGDSERTREKKRKRLHQMTLVDLAGEVITGIYRDVNKGSFVNNPAQELVDQVKSYLRNDYNDKMHFFVVEYGRNESTIDGISQQKILANLAQFLVTEKILRKSTVGVYVIVTKTDKIECMREDRPYQASEYVHNYLGSFWENLNLACKQAGISSPKILSFSIGEVFAQNLCRFDGRDTRKIIKRLLDKTYIKQSFLDIFRG